MVLIQKENHYRITQGYHIVTHDAANNSQLIYRRSLLKKWTSSVLFLETQQKPHARLAKQVVISGAAGVAMVFATGLTFYTQFHYGNLTLSLFVALVIGYMFKDRIKELLREFLNDSILSHFFEYKTFIFSRFSKKGIAMVFKG